MQEFLVLVALALGLSVVHQALDELVPFRAPAALTRTAAVAVGAGLAWLVLRQPSSAATDAIEASAPEA